MGSKLKALRIKNGKLQKDLADFLGIAERTYSHYENGSRKLKLEYAIKIATLFKVSVEEIFM